MRNLSKLLLPVLAVLGGLIGATQIYPQTGKCNVKLNVFSYVSNTTDRAPVADVNTVLINESKKTFKATSENGLPFVKNLGEGSYKIFLKKVGYRQTIDKFYLSCLEVDENNVFSYPVTMWKGPSNKTVDYSYSYEESTDGADKTSSKTSKSRAFRLADASGDAGSDGKGVLNGAALSLPVPKKPPTARAVKASGAVNVEVTIDEGGYVVWAKAVSGHPLLRAVAVDAARAAIFKPTLLSGKPVKVAGIIVYNFQ